MRKRLYLFSALLLALAFSASAQWTETNGPFGGNITDLERDGSNNTYAIVSQNLYKSTDNGANWSKLVTTSPTSLFINDLAIVSNKFYAVYYGSFYTSTDGLTWTNTAATFPFSGAVKVMKFGPDGFIAVYGTDGIFVSKDEGVTWVKASNDNVYRFGYERVVATTNGDLYEISRNVSLNNFQGVEIKKLPYPGVGGTFDPANWQTKYSTQASGTITTSTSSATVTGVGTSFTTQVTVGSALYNTAATPQFIGTVSSITNNTTLTLNSNAGIAVAGAAFYSDPYQSAAHLMSFGSNVYLVTNNNILISQDAGATWPSIKGNITAGGFWGYGAVNSNGAVYYYNGSSSEIYSLINPTPSSNTWTITPATTFSNFGTNVVCWSFVSASNIFVGTNSGGVFKSTDGGASYSVSTNGITGATTSQIIVANTSGKIIVGKYGNGYTSSIDGGLTWTNTALPSSGYASKVLKLANGNIILYGNGQIYRSSDNGSTFVWDNTYRYYDNKIIEAANGDLYLFYQAYVNPNYVPKIAKSTDSGATWGDLAITGLPATNFTVQQAAIDGTTNMIFHGYDGTASAYKTFKVVGTTATPLTMPYTGNLNNVFFQNSKFYAAQFSAFYSTSDLGTTWSAIGFSGNYVFPLKNASYSGIAVSRAGSLYISQDGGGTWSNTTLPSTSGYITNIAADASNNYYASASGSPVLKFTSALLVDPTTLPPYINFNWQALNGPYGGRVNKIAVHPDGTSLFCTTFSTSLRRLWKYNGSSWSKIEPVASNGNIFDVTIDAAGAIYVLPQTNPQKIYKSIDGGTTWNPLTSTGLPGTGTLIQRIEILSDGSILAFGSATAGGKGAIYKSTDDGASFTLKFTSAINITYGLDAVNNSRKPAISPTSPGTIAIFGAIAEGLVVSIDFGSTWTVKSTASIADPTLGFVGTYQYDKNGNLILQSIVDSTIPLWDARISKSTDDGSTWSTLPSPTISTADGTGHYSKRITVLGTGEYLMCVQSIFDCYRSADGGATWNLVGNVGDVFEWAAWRGNDSFIIGSGDAGILKTSDGGLTFNPFSMGMPHPNANAINLANKKDLVVGATRPYYSSDFGQNFSLATLEPAAHYLQVKDSLIGYGSRLLLSSKDGGKTWKDFGADRYFSFLTADATGNGFYGSDGTTLNYSTDLINWTNIVLSGLPAYYGIDNMVIDAGGVIYAIADEYSDNTFSAILSTDVYKIVFGSATKISSVIGTTSPATILYVNGKIYLYDAQGIIYKSTDGNVWTQGSAPSGNSLAVTNGYLFIPAGNSVLWLSRNDGASWQSVGDIPPSSGTVPVFRNVVINPYDGYAYATLANSVAKKSGNMVMPNDNTAPVATAYLPTVNATNVGLKPTLTITFDEITNAVAGKLVRVFDLASPAVPIETLDMSTATQNNKSWSIAATAVLSFNKTYFVVMDAGAVTDIFGNAFAGISSSATWRFTTKTIPTVSSVSPVNSATNVPLNAQFAITFSEPVSGVTGKNLNLYKTSAPTTVVTTLDGATGISSGNQLTFTFPGGTLQYATSYFIKFDASDFKTSDGGAFTVLTLNTDWTFTTIAAPDTQAPTITFTSDPIAKGAGNKTFSPSISDDIDTAPTGKIFYQSITKSTGVDSANLTHNVSTGKYDVSIPESAFGPMGLEFYFTAKDASNNKVRSPQTGFYYSYITFPAANSPQIPGGLIGVGGAVANWRIITVPHSLSDNNIATVFSELGADDFSKWRMITYKNATEWSQYPTDFTTFTRGKGYFINIKDVPATGLLIDGATTPPNNQTAPFIFSLVPGWNEIGNPYTFPMKWSEVLAANSNPTGIATVMKTYNGDYIDQTDDKLDAFEGGFVMNTNSGTVTLTVPVTGSLAGGRVAAPVSYDLANENWIAPVTLQISNKENTFGGVGMHPEALLSIDGHDDFNPPHFLDYAEMNFAHPEHFLKKTTLDVVPTQPEYSWEFTVDTNLDGIARLIWDNSRFGSNSKEMFLYDIRKGLLVNMREQNSYPFDPSNSPMFKIYYGEDLKSKIKPEGIGLGQAYPNPSQGSVTIPFTLPENPSLYDVVLEVYSVMGQKVSTLVEGQLKPGFYSFQWDAGQANASSGMHIYRLKVSDGKRSESLNGKIIINH